MIVQTTRVPEGHNKDPANEKAKKNKELSGP